MTNGLLQSLLFLIVDGEATYKNIRTSRQLRHSSKNIPFMCLTLILFHFVVLVSWLFILILQSCDIVRYYCPTIVLLKRVVINGQASRCSIRLFTDDTSLYIIVYCPLQAGQLLNRDLNAISILAHSWLVTFNPSKTLSMLISRKRNSVLHPLYLWMELGGIDETPSHERLGLTF